MYLETRSYHINTKDNTGKNNPYYGKKHSEITRKKIAERPYPIGKDHAHAKTYEVIYPDGHKKIIHCMKLFCDTHNLAPSNMYAVASSRQSNHKGYRCRLL